MSKLKDKVTIGIDLAGSPKNPTGWALLKNKAVKAKLMYADNEILDAIRLSKAAVIAIDAPLSLPKRGIVRRAEEEMIKKGYCVFPPRLPSMKKLALRAMRLKSTIAKEGYTVIEVHPTSTRKALDIPLKDWQKIQKILIEIGLKGDLITRALTPHELDAITAALTAYLHMQKQTESIGDKKEGSIIIPKKMSWSELKI